MDWVFFCRLIAIETFADNLTPDEVAAWQLESTDADSGTGDSGGDDKKKANL